MNYLLALSEHLGLQKWIVHKWLPNANSLSCSLYIPYGTGMESLSNDQDPFIC